MQIDLSNIYLKQHGWVFTIYLINSTTFFIFMYSWSWLLNLDIIYMSLYFT